MKNNYVSPMINRQMQLSNVPALERSRKSLGEYITTKYLSQTMRWMAMVLVLLGSVPCVNGQSQSALLLPPGNPQYPVSYVLVNCNANYPTCNYVANGSWETWDQSLYSWLTIPSQPSGLNTSGIHANQFHVQQGTPGSANYIPAHYDINDLMSNYCPWYTSSGSTDIFTNTTQNTLNGFYWDVPPAQNGSFYAGLFTHYKYIHNSAAALLYGEYLNGERISQPLKASLTNNKKYIVKMRSRLSATSNVITPLQLRFTNSVPMTNASTNTGVFNNITNSTSAWSLNNTCYTANGTENHLEIGLFTSNGTTPYPNNPNFVGSYQFSPGNLANTNSAQKDKYCYYFVDNVSIEQLTPNLGDDIIAECSSNVLLSTTCAVSNTTYQWYILNPVTNTYSLIPGATSISYNYNACVNATFKLEATYNENGVSCTDYDVVNVITNCCVPATSTTPVLCGSYNITGVQFAINNGTTSAINGQNFILNGVLTINQNTTISATDISLGSQSKIIVPAGKTLTITNASHLHGCNKRWAGIEVQQNGNIIINGNSVIEDADIAVNFASYNQIPNYVFNNAHFNNNFYHLFFFETPANPLNVIENCRFGTYSTTGLLPTTNTSSQFTPSGSLNYTEVSIALVKSNVTVGNGSTSIGNIFDRAKKHISIIGTSTLKVYSNSFLNSISILNYSSTLPKAVECNNIMNSQQGSISILASKNLFDNLRYGFDCINATNQNCNINVGVLNVFNNCVNGIRIKGKFNTDIQENTFKFTASTIQGYHDNSILLENVSKSSVFIGGNQIKDPKNIGISCTGMDNSITTIVNNNLSLPNLAPTATNFVGRYGIVYSRLNTNNSVVTGSSIISRCNISNNVVSNFSHGIFITNAANTQSSSAHNSWVKNNAITLRECKSGYVSSATQTSISTTGISASASTKIQITNNNLWSVLVVSTTSPTALQQRVEGIRIENTQNSRIGCNNISYAGRSINIKGSNCYPTLIANNTMFKCGLGIFIEGEIGCQQGVGQAGNIGLANDNQWTATPNKTVVYGTTNPLTNSTFYVRSINDPIRMANPSMALFASDCKYMAVGSSSLSGTQTTLTTQILTYSSPIPNTNNCSTFYPYTCNGAAAAVAIADGDIMPSNDPEIDEEKKYIQQEELYRQLIENPSMLQDPDFESFKNEKDQEAMGKLVDVGTYLDYPMDEIKRLEGEAKNDAINAEINNETNLKLLHEILLSTKELESENFSQSQIEALREIAAKCPYTDGNAVYQARVALQILGDETAFDNMNACEYSVFDDSNQRVAHTNMNSTINANFVNNGFSFDYNVNDKQEHILIITDLLGKQIATFNATLGSNTIKIATQNNSTGIYLMQEKVNNVVINNSKIIVKQ